MTKKDKFTQALLSPINPAAVVLLGMYTFIWGLWVANPFWNVFGQAELYGVLSTIAPEVFWGCLAIVVGITVMFGAWKRSYKALVRGAVLGGWHWLMIAIFYFLGDVFNTGGITALTFAAYAAFVYLNLRVNFKNDKKSHEILHCEKDSGIM